MAVSQKPVRDCLLYVFKVDLFAETSSYRISQAFGDKAVNENTAKHWFQNFKSGDLFLCREARSVRQNALDEAVKASVEEDNKL